MPVMKSNKGLYSDPFTHSYYYTSEELFLCKITVEKWTIHHFTPQNEVLTGSYFSDYCTPKTF